MNLPESTSPKSRAIGWGLRVILGLAFLLIGATKLTATANTVEHFKAIGWGQWFRYLPVVLTLLTIALAWLTWPRRQS